MIDLLILAAGGAALAALIFYSSYRSAKRVRDESYLRALKSGATHDSAVKYARQEVSNYARETQANHESSRRESEAFHYYERKNREGS